MARTKQTARQQHGGKGPSEGFDHQGGPEKGKTKEEDEAESARSQG